MKVYLIYLYVILLYKRNKENTYSKDQLIIDIENEELDGIRNNSH